MNTQKLEIAINQLERVHRDMNDCANRFILKDAIDQLQEQVKLFSIPDVSICPHPFEEVTRDFITEIAHCNKCERDLD